MSRHDITSYSRKPFPNFLLIGAAKSATTSLTELLGQHSEIFISTPKEPRYFWLGEEEYKKGWNSYQNLFRNVPKSVRASGEGSQVYTLRSTGSWPVPGRIFHRLPNVKLLYIVRNPIDRIVSNWKMDVLQKPELYTDFNSQILSYPCKKRFVDRSKYWFQISAYREWFPDEQIKILFFDEFVVSPLAVLNQCTDFLGVNRWQGYSNPEKARNAAPVVRNQTGFALRALKSIPDCSFIRKIMPSKLRNTLQQKDVPHNPADTSPKWHPEIHKKVVAEISEDVHSFLSYAGKPLDYWDLSLEE